MNKTAIFWFVLNLFSIILLAFYSMLEMASVSFNKVRLEYYVSKGYKRAIWLNHLLKNPSQLFGTTLIGVNIALVVGSECSRELYSALNLSPDLAPLTQVILVVIFGELAPMFAARHYAEHVAMLGTPIIYFSSKLMAPLLILLTYLSRLCNLVVGGKESTSKLYLNQDELQKILEEHGDESKQETESEEFSTIAANIFHLRSKEVLEVMQPFESILTLPINATISQAESYLTSSSNDSVVLYNKERSQVIGIANPRDLLFAAKTDLVARFAHPPWFVLESTSVMDVLKQFRTNNESIAIILSSFGKTSGKAIGLIHLDDILTEIFGVITRKQHASLSKLLQREKVMVIDKVFDGKTTVGEFNTKFGILLDKDPTMTLSTLIQNHLSHHPEKGESIYIAPFEMTVRETSLIDIKSVSISTKT